MKKKLYRQFLDVVLEKQPFFSIFLACKGFIHQSTNDYFKTASIFCLLPGSNAILAQTIITIDNNPTSTTTYQTIQDVLNNAATNEIIYGRPIRTSYGIFNSTKTH